MSRTTTFLAAIGLAAVLGTAPALANDPASCKTVTLSDVGWTDIQATTATAGIILGALGYEPDIQVLSVPVTYASLKNKDVDVFLGNWMPSMAENVDPYVKDGSVMSTTQNLTGAGYGLVVPTYVADAGVTDLKDVGKHADKFDHKIYGIEPGNDGNRLVLGMIKDPANGLDGFELVESSEAGMISQAQRAIRNKDWIVFLGWTPHPVMGAMDITYLTGMGDTGFGPAQVFTNVRVGFPSDCPNAAKFVNNLVFSLPMENQIMDDILNNNMEAKDAAMKWLKANPDAVKPWLDGVTTFGGGDASAAVQKALGM